MGRLDSVNPTKLYVGGMIGGVILAIGIAGIVQYTQRSSSDSGFSTWQAAPSDAPFAAQFPNTPDVGTEPLALPNGKTAIQRQYTASDAKGSVYFLFTIQYPDPIDLTTPEPVLRAGLEGMVQSSPTNRLAASTFGTFQNMPAVDFRIEDAAGNLTYRGKLFARDRTLYQLFIAHDTGSFDESAYAHFLKTFAVIP
ncbi:hypothetical protein HY632_01235 [Candidatus Uhrbacteria bacterium]|nr:hypothetical protein [Candidatus Uhrbacteria bacterium]